MCICIYTHILFQPNQPNMTHRPVLSPCPGGVVKACAAGVLPISSSLWVGETVGETVGYYFGYLSLSLQFFLFLWLWLAPNLCNILGASPA